MLLVWMLMIFYFQSDFLGKLKSSKSILILVWCERRLIWLMRRGGELVPKNIQQKTWKIRFGFFLHFLTQLLWFVVSVLRSFDDTVRIFLMLKILNCGFACRKNMIFTIFLKGFWNIGFREIIPQLYIKKKW